MFPGWQLILLLHGTNWTVTYEEGKGVDGSQLLTKHLQLLSHSPGEGKIKSLGRGNIKLEKSIASR